MEDFVTFEIAKKLKEKGFRDKCYKHYYPDSPDWFLSSYLECNNYSDYVDAPTISQALKWLREEKKMYIEPCILADGDTDADSKVINIYTYWSYSITHIESGDMIYFEYEHIDDKRFDSYEQAALAGIEYVLDNLI
jgi:hypothetical protein